jgi:hypothetical protein
MYSRKTDKTSSILRDQTGKLSGIRTAKQFIHLHPFPALLIFAP